MNCHASNHGRVMIFAAGHSVEARREGARRDRRQRRLGEQGQAMAETGGATF
jgi:hypothetical protein